MEDDCWKPSADMEILRQRAAIIAQIRQFFAVRGVLEVETPILSAAGTVDVHIQSMTTQSHSAGYNDGSAWLHTSPEFAMKRLLCAGSGHIFQICKVFRAEELGSRHNPEFSLLEWYRIEFSMLQLMAEVDELLQELASQRLDLDESVYLSYQGAFESTVSLNPLLATATELQACLEAVEVDIPNNCSRSDLLDLTMSLMVEPRLPKHALVFIYHYPADQAALAKINSNDPSVALRFEVFLNGVELGNGFEELQDCVEQTARFEAEHSLRAQQGKQQVPIDCNFLAGLSEGLPRCSGVAIGVDRLLMALLAKEGIAEVVSFSAENA
jgi:lysyl-tRNA synthetase class 2